MQPSSTPFLASQHLPCRPTCFTPISLTRTPRRLPFFLVYFIALVVQIVVVPLCRLLGRDLQSDFTPSRIKITAANRTFSCAAARRDFGYEPKVSVDEGLRRTMKHFAHLHASKQKKG